MTRVTTLPFHLASSSKESIQPTILLPIAPSYGVRSPPRGSPDESTQPVTLKECARTYRTVTRRIRMGMTWPEKASYIHRVRDPHTLTLPDYMCIGGQKCGTTWLFRNCRAHPDIFVAREKEVHYFDQNFHWSLGAYAARFLEGKGRIKGEFTPAYSVLPKERIRFIHQVIPNLRIILLLRHPVERAWSQALMELVHREKRSFETVAEEEFMTLFRSSWSAGRGDFATILDNWCSFFPEEQILVGLQEEMAQEPRALMERICRHIGASTEIDWSTLELDQVCGKGLGVPLPDRYREVLWDIYREPLARLHARLGDRIAHWLSESQTVTSLP